MHIIIAPHVDDEVIGCYELLAANSIDKVIYITDFGEVTGPRKLEALKCAVRFKFKAIFCTLAEVNQHLVPNCTLYVPSVKDLHPHHKLVNLLAHRMPCRRHIYLKFYSVEMNFAPRLLDEDVRNAKLDALTTLFPSQAALFNSDAKYWLFESIRGMDGELSQVVNKALYTPFFSAKSIERLQISHISTASDFVETVVKRISESKGDSLEDIIETLHAMPELTGFEVELEDGEIYKWSMYG